VSFESIRSIQISSVVRFRFGAVSRVVASLEYLTAEFSSRLRAWVEERAGYSAGVKVVKVVVGG
jgi:hypothetical protein